MLNVAWLNGAMPMGKGCGSSSGGGLIGHADVVAALSNHPNISLAQG